MCGICGWVGGEAEPDGEAIAHAMSATLAHRGPDGQALAAVGAGASGWFGHRRLRVLDLTSAADQPMRSEAGRLLLTFNGEIYNFQALRRELRRLGAQFRSSGDTEVVLRAYEQWGPDAVSRLDGMFAFALWDADRRELILARDRTGKKPLFYGVFNNRLTFASEIKALARAPWLPLKPALAQLPALLAFGCCSAPNTPYEGILQLAPAHVARFSPDSLALDITSYWSALPQRRPQRVDRGLIEGIRADVEDATRRRLISDVPLGALLSGGIDSSVVVALMQRHAEHDPVRTFSVGFPEEPTYDERSHAREVAAALGTRHKEFAVNVDAAALLDRLVWLHDGPFGDSSAIPTYLVCAAARTDVTVVLTGDGGDEIFGGYQRFAAAALSRALPPALVAAGRALAPWLPSSGGYHNPAVRLRRFLSTMDLPLQERYLGWLAICDSELIQALTGDANGSHTAARDFERAFDCAASAAADRPHSLREPVHLSAR